MAAPTYSSSLPPISPVHNKHFFVLLPCSDYSFIIAEPASVEAVKRLQRALDCTQQRRMKDNDGEESADCK